MGASVGTRKMNASDLEAWLGRVLVPVEPGDRFITRLRGRLVELRGARPTRGWIGLAALVALALGMAMWLGVALRLWMVALTAIGILLSRRRP